MSTARHKPEGDFGGSCILGNWGRQFGVRDAFLAAQISVTEICRTEFAFFP